MPVIFHNNFSKNFNVHGHDTRKRTDLHQFTINSHSKLCSVSCGTKLWNLLPEELKLVTSVSVFKKRVHNYMVDLTFSFE